MTSAKELLEQATPLPWVVSEERNLSESLTIMNDLEQAVVHDYCHGCGGVESEHDAALIVYAVNRLPDYEAAVDALSAFVEWADMGGRLMPGEHLRGARAALARLRGES